MRFRPIPCVVAVLCLLLLLPIEFAKADPTRADRPVWPPAGSTWTTSLKVSGSFGSGVREETLESMGEVDWEGRRVMGIHIRGRAQLLFDMERRIVAQTRDGKTIQTYHPYEALYEWPLFVGKSWSSDFQVKNLEHNRTGDYKYVFTVEAFEEITVPAGTFKAFRIRRSTSPRDTFVHWYEPRLGVEVKRDWERFEGHMLGAGTYQMEMLSHAIKN
jgi:hypothetical protein